MELALDDYDAEGVESVSGEHFRVTDDAQAAWAFRKLRSARARISETNRVADGEIERIDQWRDRTNEPLLRDVNYFEGLLTAYAEGQRAEGRKSVDTPYGVVRSRTVAPTVAAENEQDFFEWARVHRPSWIRIKESLDLKAIKDETEVEFTETLGPVVITGDGEIVPGLVGKPGRVSFTVEVERG